MKHSLAKTLLTVALVMIVGLGAFFALSPDTAQAASDEPIMRIAFFADLHIEFGLQANDTPMRMATAKTMQYVRQLSDSEGVDLVMVGGDMSGGRGAWTQPYIKKTMDSVYEFMAKGTKDGKVLFVTGNHDPEPSAKVGTPAGGVYSGDYSSYMLDNVGKFVSDLYTSDIDDNLSPYDELLCYRYTINGIEFIGLNTPYLKEQGKVWGLYAEQTKWLEEELEKIGQEKTVFLMCHYPKNSFATIVGPETAASGNTCQSDMNRLLAKYTNIIYCYGHVHNGENWWAKTKTTDVVKLEGKTSLAAKGVYRNSGIIYAHMGSMGYYDNVYQPGGLTSADPQVCQFVMVELYANRITFQSHNTGAKYHPQGTKEIQPITVARNLAAQFGLPESEGIITSVSTNTMTLTSDSEVSDVTDTVDTPATETTPAVSEGVASDDVDATTTDEEILEDASSGTVLIVVLCVVVVLAGAVVAAAVLLKKKK